MFEPNIVLIINKQSHIFLNTGRSDFHTFGNPWLVDSRTNCLKLLILIDLPCCCLQLEFLIIRHIFYHLLKFHNSSLNFHSEILAGYFIKSTKKEYFVKLIEIVPGFHYCSASCFANCFSTPKIDRVIIINNFQRSIFI